jgi:hypothetical protein
MNPSSGDWDIQDLEETVTVLSLPEAYEAIAVTAYLNELDEGYKQCILDREQELRDWKHRLNTSIAIFCEDMNVEG